VPHADVRIVSQTTPLASRTSRADRDGRFEFVDVPAGKLRVVASKPGYESVPLPGEDGAFPLYSGGVLFDLGEGQTRENVDVKLRRDGTVAGRVLDENGDPMEGASVQLLHVPAEGDDAWQDPAFLEAVITRATMLTLGDAQKVSLNLKLASR
jgi:hypothetical protein